VRILVVCSPREGIDPATEIMPLAGDEMEALQALRDRGLLREAYSPGGPGAVLMFEGARAEVDRALEELPMIRAGAIQAVVTELHPFAALDG
jgi:hypothetical protein